MSLEDAVRSHPSRYDDEDTSPTTARELKGWYSYAIAAEVFAVVGTGTRPCITLLTHTITLWPHTIDGTLTSRQVFSYRSSSNSFHEREEFFSRIDRSHVWTHLDPEKPAGFEQEQKTPVKKTNAS